MKYAIISDIHANLEALSVVIDKCKESGVDKYVCLGDIVGYNANPREALEIIRGLDLVGVVKGNHDEYVSNNDEVMEGFNPHAKQAVLWTKSQLDDEMRQWLQGLPMKLTIRGGNMTIVHATLDTPEAWGYVFDTHHAADNFTYQFTQLCFCGHSHVPIMFSKKPVTVRSDNPIEEETEWALKRNEGPHSIESDVADNITFDIQDRWKYLINVGSVGQPRNRDPRASFAIFDFDNKRITRHRLPYDIERAQAKIREAQLPERLAKRLATGN